MKTLSHFEVKVISEKHSVIFVNSKGYEFPDDVHRAKTSLLLSFDDSNPESSSLKAATTQDIEQVIAFIYNYINSSPSSDEELIFCSDSKSIRFSLLICGLSIAGLEPRSALAQVLRIDLTVLPSSWIIAIFDYIQQLGGQLINAVDDYLEMGLLVTKELQVIKAPWCRQ